MMDSPVSLLSDNAAGVHPLVMAEMQRCNQGHAAAYGADATSQQALAAFRREFGDVDVYLMLTGTAANVVAVQCALRSVESVICAESAHLHLDECGAPEKFVGCKVLTVPSEAGKISVAALDRWMTEAEDVHRSRPRMVSIAQCTEWGTVYSPQELREIADFCHRHQMWLHMDGARLANAAAALGLSLRAASLDCGVDLLSLGGTKNGLMGAEALIVVDPTLAVNAAAYRKQAMQLASKMRFVAAQFIAFFRDELWRCLASHSNQMAALLAGELKDVGEVQLAAEVQTNAVFARIPLAWVEPLQAHTAFSMWDAKTVRWMTAFDHQEKDILRFVERVREFQNRGR